MSTGISVNDKDWNPDKEIVRRTNPNYKTVNEILKQKVTDAEEVQNDLSKTGNDTAKAITERLRSVNKADFFTIADILKEEFLSERKFYASKHIKVVLKKLEKFEKERFLSLKRLDAAYLERFERFLVSKYKNKPNTIHKDFKVIRKIVKRALKLHLMNDNPFFHFDGAKKKKSIGKTKLSFVQINIRSITEWFTQYSRARAVF
jgi:DNA-binding ferritin-like protein